MAGRWKVGLRLGITGTIALAFVARFAFVALGATSTPPAPAPVSCNPCVIVIDVPAWDETVTIIEQPAWDEEVSIHVPAYDREVVVVDEPAYTAYRTVVDTPERWVVHRELIREESTETYTELVEPAHSEEYELWVMSGYTESTRVDSGYWTTELVSRGEWQPVWITSGYWTRDWVTSGYWTSEWVNSGYWYSEWVNSGYWYSVWVNSGYWYSAWVSSGYWHTYWVSSGYWSSYWVDTSGWRSYWVDNSYYQYEWVDTSYWQPAQCWDSYNGWYYDCGYWVNQGYWRSYYVSSGYWQSYWENSGYWQSYWVDTSRYESQWIDTSHYEDRYQDTSHYEDRYQDTSHYEDRYQDTSRYVDRYHDTSQWVDNFHDTSHWGERWVDTSYYADKWVDTSTWRDEWVDTSHYETATRWVDDRYATVTRTIPAEYSEREEYVAAVTHEEPYEVPAVTHVEWERVPEWWDVVTVHHPAITRTTTVHHLAIGHLEQANGGTTESRSGSVYASSGVAVDPTEPVLIPVATTLTLIEVPAYDEQSVVVDQPAYDEVRTVVDVPAYDEVRTVVDQPAWDEEVTTTTTTTECDAEGNCAEVERTTTEIVHHPAVTHEETVHHPAVTHEEVDHYPAVTRTVITRHAAVTRQQPLSFTATVLPTEGGDGGPGNLAEFAALMGLVAAAGAGRYVSTRDVLRQTLAQWATAGRAVPLSIACMATDSQLGDEELAAGLTISLALADPYAGANVLGNVDDGSDATADIDVALSESLTLPSDFGQDSGALSAIGALSASVLSVIFAPIWDSAVSLLKRFLQWTAYGMADAVRDLDDPNWLVKASAMLVLIPSAVAASAGSVLALSGAGALARTALVTAMAAFHFLVLAGRAVQAGFAAALSFVANRLRSFRDWITGMNETAIVGAARLEQSVLDTFSGTPNVFVTDRPMTAYRYIGNASQSIGRFMTTAGTKDLINSSDEAISALNLGVAGNPATTLVRILIPSGTPVWYGNVAGGAQWATQLFVEQRFLSSLRVISSTPMMP